MSEMDDRRRCAVWRIEDCTPASDVCTNEREEMLTEIVRLRAAAQEAAKALAAADEYMWPNVPADGWGLCDKGADADRKVALELTRAALASLAKVGVTP